MDANQEEEELRDTLYRGYINQTTERKGEKLRKFATGDDRPLYDRIKAHITKKFFEMTPTQQGEYLKRGVPDEELDILGESIERDVNAALFISQGSPEFLAANELYYDFTVLPLNLRMIYTRLFVPFDLPTPSGKVATVFVPKKLIREFKMEDILELPYFESDTIDLAETGNHLASRNLNARGFYDILRYINLACPGRVMPTEEEYKARGIAPSAEEIAVFNRMEEPGGVIRLVYRASDPVPPFIAFWTTAHFLVGGNVNTKHVFLAAWDRYVSSVIRATPRNLLWQKFGAGQNWEDDTEGEQNQRNRRAKTRALVKIMPGTKYTRTALLANNTTYDADVKAAQALGVRPDTQQLTQEVGDLELTRKIPKNKQVAGKVVIKEKSRKAESAAADAPEPKRITGVPRTAEEPEPEPTNNNNNNRTGTIGDVIEIDD